MQVEQQVGALDERPHHLGAAVSTVVAGWSSRPQVRLKSSSIMRDLNGVRGSKE
jgi:hypothetical protein